MMKKINIYNKTLDRCYLSGPDRMCDCDADSKLGCPDRNETINEEMKKKLGEAGNPEGLSDKNPQVILTDDVEHPSHYNIGKVECIDAIESALTPEEFRGYLKGNIMKYTWRERQKEGDKAMRKAKWYLQRLLDTSNKDTVNNDKQD